MFDEKRFAGELKRKGVMVDEEQECYLSLKIFSAEDIDRATMNPNGDMRRYQALIWVRHKDENYITNIASGLPNPSWDSACIIPLGIYEPYKYFLHVEVYRMCSKSDPGPSSGIALVGKTRIPLPKLGHKICGRFGLVRPNDAVGPSSGSSSDLGCIAEGHIILNMETKTFF
ncbi:Uncharacterized protein Adt_10814 [Abeliophyllum distichum]|uniref:C2 domain-containing protein n=1 Tax=Abeliophyllum distichum TaxID=126358 RepID=A0ABD1ULA4_9LAMI